MSGSEAGLRAAQLQEATSAMASALTTSEVSEAFLTISRRVFGAVAGVVYVIDAGGALQLMAGSGVPDVDRPMPTLPMDAQVPLADALRDGQPLWLRDRAAFVKGYPHLASTPTSASSLQAVAALPLLYAGRRVGGLALSFDRPQAFAGEERSWLEWFASQCALAIERARLYMAEKRARTEAETLLRVADAINNADLDLETIVQKVTDEATGVVAARFGAFFCNVQDAQGEAYQLYTLSGAPREAFEKLGLPRNTPIFAPTFFGEGVVRIADVQKDPRYGTMGPHHGLPEGHLPVTSYLAAPVISRTGAVLGGLFFAHPEPGRFTEGHERLARGMAAVAAVAIDNAMLVREARAAEARHRRVAEEMAETVRLNELFTGVLAHDLRNPLTGIITAVRLAAGRTGDQQLSKPLSRIETSARRMTSMVDQLLDVARVRLGQSMPLDPRSADLLPVVAHVVDELEDSRGGRTVSVEQEGDTAGRWDLDRLAQVFSNLIGNALQHGTGGDVQVLIDGKAAEQVVARIRNQGLIPATMIPTLFDPFSAAHRSHERSRGLGLGLFIAQEIARTHGGTLTVDSSREDGTTTFVLTLPRFVAAGRAAGASDNRPLAEARERAYQSEQRMRLLVNSIRDYGIFMLDLQGRVASWNAGAQRIKGYSADEIIGKHLSVFYTAEDREAGRPAALLALAANQGSIEDLGWRVRKDGTPFWADVIITALRDSRGELCGFAKVTRDLTERREQEERLRRSEEQLRLMVESVRDYAIFRLDPSGHVSSWNAGAERIKGYRASEIIGQHFSVFYEQAEIDGGKCERELEGAAREGRFEDEGWRLRKDGTRFWANVVITALCGEGGELLGFAKITRDLTDRRRLEDERLRRAQAEEAIRLRDEFLTMVSHELKTPLTGLQLQLQGLLRRVQSVDEKVALHLHRAAASGNRLEALIELLLDVTTMTDGRFQVSPEPLDIGAVVTEVVDRLRESAVKVGSDIQVHTEGLLVGRWDRLRIEQLVASLLSNALKYGAGHPIDLTVTGRSDDVVLEVRDRGPGIAEADQQGLFQRFSRRGSTRHHGGLGLGLYLVQEIARAHGGNAEVRNPSDGGVCFVVQLPREPPLAVARGPRPGSCSDHSAPDLDRRGRRDHPGEPGRLPGREWLRGGGSHPRPGRPGQAARHRRHPLPDRPRPDDAGDGRRDLPGAAAAGPGAVRHPHRGDVRLPRARTPGRRRQCARLHDQAAPPRRVPAAGAAALPVRNGADELTAPPPALRTSHAPRQRRLGSVPPVTPARRGPCYGEHLATHARRLPASGAVPRRRRSGVGVGEQFSGRRAGGG
jgi:PAS domain S-box-containing protein